MATSYKKKGAQTKKAAALVGQDPPIIIKPGVGGLSTVVPAPGLTVKVENLDDGTIRTDNTLGNPQPHPPHVLYTHNHPTYHLKSVTIVVGGITICSFDASQWPNYEIKLYYGA